MNAGVGRAALLAAWIFGGAACVPVVTHGPRVEPGFTAGAVVSVATQPILERELDFGGGTVSPVLPPNGVFGRIGWTPESADIPVPISLGVFLPLAGPFGLMHPEGDLYAQLLALPDPWIAGGAGVLVSPSSVTPYLQLGRDHDDDLSIYTTQAFAYFHGGRGTRASFWMPSVTVKASRVHLWVQGGLGRERPESAGEPPRSRGVRFVMGGATVEVPVERMRWPWR